MGCYFGGETPANRLRWTFFVLFFVAGWVFVGVYLVKKTACPQTYLKCIDELYYEEKIGPLDRIAARKVEMTDWTYHSLSTSVEVQVCLQELNDCAHSAIKYIIVFVCLFVASSVPIFLMMCFSEKPYDYYDDMCAYSPLDSVVQMQSMKQQQQQQQQQQLLQYAWKQ